MKDTINVPLLHLFGIIAFLAVMGLCFIACDDGGGGDNNDGNNNNGNDEPTHVHDWGDWVEITAPTLITEGEETRTCKDDPSHTDTRAKAILITTTDLWDEAITLIKGKTGGEYTLTIGGDVGVEGSTFGTTAAGESLSVTLKGRGKLYLTSEGSLLTISNRQTLIIDSENLTLQGLQNNNNPMVVSNGTLELKKGTLSGNTNSRGNRGGVLLQSGTFTMNGGKISGNTAVEGNGGGVRVTGGTFTMNDGKISGNTAASGGGGGGVATNGGIFIINGGEISGNTASTNGGGVRLQGTFTMNGGEISGNTASNSGGGVYGNFGTFCIVTGTIYGSNAEESLRNTATSSGAALYKGSSTAERGTFSGAEWNKAIDGDLDTTNDTIKVKDGLIVP